MKEVLMDQSLCIGCTGSGEACVVCMGLHTEHGVYQDNNVYVIEEVCDVEDNS